MKRIVSAPVESVEDVHDDASAGTSARAPVDLATRLNRRFRTAPWDDGVAWGADGRLAAAGVLFHVIDGWEANGEAWAPPHDGPGATDSARPLP